MAEIDRRTMMKAAAAGGAISMTPLGGLSAKTAVTPPTDVAAFDHFVTRHRVATVAGLEIFYREAGKADAPAVLLLHGFPTSSHMFRHLIPALAGRFRVIAPDYPAFGYGSFPPRDQYRYTFGGLTDVVAQFTDAVGLSRYAIYIQDYGAPIGLRLALKRPDAIRAIVTQNGNAYEEGLSRLWDPLKAYWADPSLENRAVLQGWLGQEGTRLQYSAGVRDDQSDRLAPDTWALDWQSLSRPGNADVQIDLFGDYRSNVELYPEFQRFLRERQPPILVLWGRNDPFFTVQGAEAFLRDVPAAELDLIDASHFLLETHGAYAAHRISDFLQRSLH